MPRSAVLRIFLLLIFLAVVSDPTPTFLGLSPDVLDHSGYAAPLREPTSTPDFSPPLVSQPREADTEGTTIVLASCSVLPSCPTLDNEPRRVAPVVFHARADRSSTTSHPLRC